MESFKLKRSMIQDLQLQLQESERIFSSVSSKEAEKLQQVHVLEAKCESAMRDIEDQNVKRNRALQFVQKASKALRKKEGKTFLTATEQDFLIRAIREIGTLSLKDLEILTKQYPELEGKVSSLMELQGLKAPSRSVSRVSSRASSFGDLTSPISSGRNSAVGFQRFAVF